MTIEIKQTCDGCGRDRDISQTSRGERIDLTAADNGANVGGWVEVGVDTHLCPGCVKRATDRRR